MNQRRLEHCRNVFHNTSLSALHKRVSPTGSGFCHHWMLRWTLKLGLSRTPRTIDQVVVKRHLFQVFSVAVRSCALRCSTRTWPATSILLDDSKDVEDREKTVELTVDGQTVRLWRRIRVSCSAAPGLQQFVIMPWFGFLAAFSYKLAAFIEATLQKMLC